MTAKIIKVLTTIKGIGKVMNKQVLSCVKRIKPQWSHKAILENVKYSKGFDQIKKTKCTTEPEQNVPK